MLLIVKFSLQSLLPPAALGIPCFALGLDFLVEITLSPLWLSVGGGWTGVLVSSPSSESWSGRENKNQKLNHLWSKDLAKTFRFLGGSVLQAIKTFKTSK